MNARSKSGGDDVVTAEIRALLESQSQVRDWLVRLDDLAQQYRPGVEKRVRADYEARLLSVTRELESHRGALEKSLEGRRAIHAEVGQRFEAESAEIEEIELRFQIGELDEATWTDRREKHVMALEAIEAELGAAAGAMRELEAVLADFGSSPGERAAPVPPSPPKSAEPVAEKAPVMQRRPETSVGEAESAEPVEPDGQDDEFMDELAFLESLSLDEPDSFDAVSRMLDDEETTEGEGSRRADR
ncbi:MAG: hypothetical protein OEM96_08525 [Gemmatimonadota bacterium]|nr:hypothetical protein [Gemmatimonadota bacterium]